MGCHLSLGYHGDDMNIKHIKLTIISLIFISTLSHAFLPLLVATESGISIIIGRVIASRAAKVAISATDLVGLSRATVSAVKKVTLAASKSIPLKSALKTSTKNTYLALATYLGIPMIDLFSSIEYSGDDSDPVITPKVTFINKPVEWDGKNITMKDAGGASRFGYPTLPLVRYESATRIVFYTDRATPCYQEWIKSSAPTISNSWVLVDQVAIKIDVYQYRRSFNNAAEVVLPACSSASNADSVAQGIDQDDANAALTPAQLTPLINGLLERTASVEGYDGVPYEPVTVEDVAKAMGTGTGTLRRSELVKGFAGTDSPEISLPSTVDNNAGVVDWGDVPDYVDLKDPVAPTANEILSPFRDMQKQLNSQLNFTIRSGECPALSFHLFNTDYLMRDHCDFLERNTDYIRLLFHIAALITAFRIFLTA